MVTLQITLFATNGKYKPMSTLINVESIEEYKRNPTFYKMKAIQKICNQRYLTGKELQAMTYTHIKVRNYTLYKEITENKKEEKKKWKIEIDLFSKVLF